jgi:hypothetical protein
MNCDNQEMPLKPEILSTDEANNTLNHLQTTVGISADTRVSMLPGHAQQIEI